MRDAEGPGPGLDAPGGRAIPEGRGTRALRVTYRFETRDGTRTSFRLELDPQSLQASPPEGELPEWTRLNFRQCPDCLLDSKTHPFCPSAALLPGVVQAFNHLVSHERARVEVETAERTCAKELPVQSGIGALMGLVMATSGCPLTVFFRPMARFHLPFATQEETIYRAASAYLLADHLRVQEQGGEPDQELRGLRRVYERVHALNAAFFNRLKAAARTDSSLNALVHLDMFALMLPLQIDLRLPEVLEYFRPFLEADGA